MSDSGGSRFSNNTGGCYITYSGGNQCYCSCHNISIGVKCSLCVCNKTQSVSLSDMEKRIKSLEERMNVKMEQWDKYFKENSSKKPHKCPLCYGHGKFGYPEVLQTQCHSCEGKGIVWG